MNPRRSAAALLLFSLAVVPVHGSPGEPPCSDDYDRVLDELVAFVTQPALTDFVASLPEADREELTAELAVAVEDLLVSLEARCGPRLGAHRRGALRRVRVIRDGESGASGDGRRALTAEERALFRAVGVIEGKGFEGGTAALIGDCRTVVTAAHVVQGIDGVRTPDVAFLPQGDPERATRVDWAGSFLPPATAFLGRAAIDHDLAVLALAEAVPDCNPLGYATLRNRDFAAWGQRIWSVSFHRDTGWDPVVHPGCAIANERVDRDRLRASGYVLDPEGQQDRVLLHHCDTAAGSSGSPLMILVDGVPYVIGVNTGAPSLPEGVGTGQRDELPGALKDRYPNHGVLFSEDAPAVRALDLRLSR
jgi:V8-like Glu-specific endopeptidase